MSTKDQPTQSDIRPESGGYSPFDEGADGVDLASSRSAP